jgi:hypothetical protein
MKTADNALRLTILLSDYIVRQASFLLYNRIGLCAQDDYSTRGGWVWSLAV